jgi:hypothetical protein
MLHRLFVPGFLLLQALNSFAQTEPEKKAKPLLMEYSIGLQANQLMKQLINLSNSPAVSNPYLLTASVSSGKYFGINVHAALGYSYSHLTDVESPTNHESKINQVDYRYGIGKNFTLGTKWEASVGVDMVEQYKVNKTFATSVTIFSTTTDSVETVSTSKTTAKGKGLQLTLAYHLSPHILLGTEATFYYITSHIKQNGEVYETISSSTNPDSDTYTFEATNSETKEVAFTTTAPVALFLIVKF